MKNLLHKRPKTAKELAIPLVPLGVLIHPIIINSRPINKYYEGKITKEKRA